MSVYALAPKNELTNYLYQYAVLFTVIARIF